MSLSYFGNDMKFKDIGGTYQKMAKEKEKKIDMARSMWNEERLLIDFWAEVVVVDVYR